MVFKDLTLEYHFHHQYYVLIPNHTVGIFIQAHFFPIQILPSFLLFFLNIFNQPWGSRTTAWRRLGLCPQGFSVLRGNRAKQTAAFWRGTPPCLPLVLHSISYGTISEFTCVFSKNCCHVWFESNRKSVYGEMFVLGFLFFVWLPK